MRPCRCVNGPRAHSQAFLYKHCSTPGIGGTNNTLSYSTYLQAVCKNSDECIVPPYPRCDVGERFFAVASRGERVEFTREAARQRP